MVDVPDPRNSGRPAFPSPARVAVWQIDAHKRSRTVCHSFCKGLQACGDIPVLLHELYFANFRDRFHEFAAHVFYGLQGNLPRVFEQAIAHSRAVYVDLGYWGRRDGGRFQGFHKITVNHRHPVGYYRSPAHPSDRIRALGIKALPWRTRPIGGHILLVGMSSKAAWAEGFKPLQWERATANQIGMLTDRPIIYRPKPSDPHVQHISGTILSPPDRPLELDLTNCWAVVSHHSNVAVDALTMGVPSFCWGGVGRDKSSQNLEDIEQPRYPDERDQWLADIAYTQWSIPEIEQGLPWNHLRTEGLV